MISRIASFALVAALTSAVSIGKRGRGGKEAYLLAKYDDNGDGMIDADEKAAAKEALQAKRLEKFDTNGDGSIDDDEKAAAKAAAKAAGKKPKGRGRGKKPSQRRRGRK